MNLIIVGIIGLIGGLASGLFGVGGGAIFVPLLVFLVKFDIHLAVGTSIAVIVPTAIMGIYKHGTAGMIDWKTVALLSVFAMIGAFFGAQLSLKLDVVTLRRLFAGFLLFLSLKLFFPN